MHHLRCMRAAHPVAEVRGRALQSLDFKWKFGLVAPEELAGEPRVLTALLREWPCCGRRHTASVAADGRRPTS